VLKLLQLGRRGLVTRGLAARRDGEVAHGRVQEGLEAGREAKAGELPQDIQEGFLQHIQRRIAVPGEPISEPTTQFRWRKYSTSKAAALPRLMAATSSTSLHEAFKS